MPVKIHGREYSTVAERIQQLHAATAGKYSIATEIVSWDGARIVMRATLEIADCGSYTGHAYEDEKSSQINKTSALENCETSAIGRALAAAGYGGGEYASANEVSNAIHQQQNGKPDSAAEFLKACNDLHPSDAALYAVYKQYEVMDLHAVPADKRRAFYGDLKAETQAQKAGV